MSEIMDKDYFIPMVQRSCLGIVKEIDTVCRKNGIAYSLCGGSVIGAHLYQGFIPWDDDIDLMMSRMNYDKFVAVFPRQSSERYRLLNYATEKKADIPTLFSRVEDTNTEVTEEIAGHVRSGHVFVDVTVMDNVTSKLNHKIAFLYGGYIYCQLYRHNGMIPGTGWKKILFSLLPGKLDTGKSLSDYGRYEKFCRRNMKKTTKFCAELLSSAYSKFLYKREFFDKYINVQFEDIQLMVIRDYMDYLHLRYGKREFTKEVPQNQRFNTHIIEFHVKESAY